MYRIIQNRKIWLSLSSLTVGFSMVALIIWGLNFGIDFTGGSLLEVKFFQSRPGISEVQEALDDLDLGSLIVQPVDEDGMILRFQDTSEDKHQEALKRLNDLVSGDEEEMTEETNIEEPKDGPGDSEITENQIAIGDDSVIADVGTSGSGTLEIEKIDDEKPNVVLTGLEELRYDSVGPSIGEELKRKSLYAIVLVIIAIVLYIAWAFSKVSRPIASWKYGVTAIIALFHDILITMGVFAVLGELYNIEINTPFVAAILTVLGYSVNDTIVVFDRIRENLPKSDEDFEGTVNISVNQTITRSINTSFTTLMVLISILVFGGNTIKDFVLALSIGVFVGTYSSIFLASPILVVWEKIKK